MAPLFPLILRRRNSGNTSNKSKKMSSPPNGDFLPALTTQGNTVGNICFSKIREARRIRTTFFQNQSGSHYQTELHIANFIAEKMTMVHTCVFPVIIFIISLTSDQQEFLFDIYFKDIEMFWKTIHGIWGGRGKTSPKNHFVVVAGQWHKISETENRYVTILKSKKQIIWFE